MLRKTHSLVSALFVFLFLAAFHTSSQAQTVGVSTKVGSSMGIMSNGWKSGGLSNGWFYMNWSNGSNFSGDYTSLVFSGSDASGNPTSVTGTILFGLLQTASGNISFCNGTVTITKTGASTATLSYQLRDSFTNTLVGISSTLTMSGGISLTK